MRARKTNRRGVTLLELLIVATIMLLLMVVSVPMLKPMLQSQATRNGAATVSTYLNRARSRAMLTGRPCGVRFEVWDGSDGSFQLTNQNNLSGNAANVPLTTTTDSTYLSSGKTMDVNYGACLVMRQVEVPPVYSGLTESATADVSEADIDGATVTLNDIYWNSFSDAKKIQFDNMGPYYPCTAGASEISFEKLPGAVPFSATAVPFKILRRPGPTMTAPVGMPQGTAVDLLYSGEDNNSEDPTKYTQVTGDFTIMFSPSGEVDSVTGWNGPEIPISTLYLLIGRWERLAVFSDDDKRLFSIEEDGLTNIADGTCFWVTVNPRTGMVTTAEVNTDINSNASLAQAIYQSREFARDSKRNIGGY